MPETEQTPEPPKSDWLFAEGNRIVDADGRPVWITGLNWFGFNTPRKILDGLQTLSMRDTVFEIADRGFNLIRVPLSVDLVNAWSRGVFPPRPAIDTALNPNLTEEGTLAYLDYLIEVCGEAGVKVMLDIHSVTGKDGAHMYNVWYDDDFDVAAFYGCLAFLAHRYKDDDTVVAFDLKNEPHGNPNDTPRAVWNDSEDETENWKYVAEQAAKAVLAENPNALIAVEGIAVYPKNPLKNGDYYSKNGGDYYYDWWGGSLRGVKHFPVDLGDYQNKLVYSPHDYGPQVSNQPWFRDGYDFDSLYNDVWRDNWLFIHEDETAPLLIGEWGGGMKEPNLTWMTAMRRLIIENQLNHTFWCLNPNSGDTGGLLLDDWRTWDEEKYAFLKPALWQRDGRFVGLSARTPLGRDGLTRAGS